MKLHLPTTLRAALLSTFAVISATLCTANSRAFAEEADALYQMPTFQGSAEFTWTGDGDDDALGTVGNWASGTAPTANGAHMIFNGVTVVTTGTPGNTSADAGGISATNSSNVTASLGNWGGAIYVDATSTLTTSFNNALKNAQADGEANVYVEGTLNLTTPGGSLVLDNGPNAKNHYWHIGPTGTINMANTTGLNKNGFTWNVEVVVSQTGAPSTEGVVNRTVSNDALVKRQFMTTGANLSGALDSLIVWLDNGDGTFTSLTQATSWTGADENSFVLVSTPNGMSIQYKSTGFASETLVWNSTDGTWTEKGTGWYKQGDADKTDTSFLNNDSVIFTAAEGNKTVALAGTLDTGSVTFEDATQYTLNMGESDSLTSVTFAVGDNASLTLGDHANITVLEGTTIGSGTTLALGDSSLTSATLTLGDNARITVADGKTASVASIVTFGTGNSIALGEGSSLTLGSTAYRMASFSGTVTGGTNSMFSVWLTNANSTVTLSPESTITDITVYGNYAANLANQAAADTLNGATLHIGGGTTFIIRAGAGVIRPSDQIIVEGNMRVNMSHGTSEKVSIASDIVGGAGVTANNSIVFYRTEHLSLTLTGNIDYAGAMAFDSASGGYSPHVIFQDNTVSLGALNIRWSLGQFTFNNSQATIGTISLDSNWDGNRVTVNDGSVVNSANVRLSNKSTINVNGGELHVTGTTNDHSATRSFIIDNASTLNLNGGLIESAAILSMGYDGTGTFNLLGGTANLNGITFWATGSDNFRGNLLLGTETTGEGRLNIGSNGIINVAKNASIQFGKGTLGATANWALGYNTQYTPAYVSLVASEGFYVDTVDAIDGTTARTITFNNGLTGSGKMTKIGAGTLVLNGAAKAATDSDAGFTGTVELLEGSLNLKDSSVIGNGTLLIGGGRTATVTNANKNYSLGVGSSLGSTALNGQTATLAGNLQLNGGSLVFNELSTSVAALTATSISFGENATTTINLDKGQIDTAETYLILAGSGITADNLDSFALGGTTGLLYSAVFGLNADNTLTLQFAERTDIKTWVSGTWNTTADNNAWLQNGAPTSFTDGDTVYFTNSGTGKTVAIEGTVAPANVVVSGTDYVFEGTGTIASEGSLALAEDASLTINNANTFAGGATLKTGSTLVVNNKEAIGTTNFTLEGTSVLDIRTGTWNGLSTRIAAGSRGTVKISGDTVATIKESNYGLNFDVGSGRTLNLNAGIYAGNITGAGNLTENNAGTITVSGTINIDGDYRGVTGNEKAHTLTLTQNGSMTVNNFYGRYQNENLSTINVNSGSSLIAKSTLQIARDGRAVLNIAEGALVAGATMNMGANEGWTSTDPAKKKATVNLNGGTLLIGAGGIVTKTANNPYEFNMVSGTLGTTSETGWSTGLNMVLSSTTGGELTVDTRQYNLVNKTYTDRETTTITINGVLSGSGNLKKTGSGTLELGGVNTYTGKTTVQNGTLNFTNTAAATMHSIAMGAAGHMTSSSTAITLASGSTLEFDMTGAVANNATPFISWNAAALSLADASHSVTLSGLEDLKDGSYTLATWNSLATAGNVFTLTNPGTSADGFFSYELVYNDDRTALLLVVTDTRINSGFVWNGGSDGASKWINDNVDGWELRGTATGTTLDGQDIFFTATEEGEVVVSGTVTPNSVLFSGGTYTLTSDPADTGSIADKDTDHKTALTVSGNATNVTLNLANAYTGGTNLNGGKLTIGADGALGTEGDIVFNGGTLIYAAAADAIDDITGYDISSRIKMGDGPGKLNIGIAGQGDIVSWNALSADVLNTENTTLTKTGAGTLALGYTGSSLAHLTVKEGVLDFTASGLTVGKQANATLIQVDEGAHLSFSGGALTLYAQLNGKGRITIGSATTAGAVSINNTGNTNFTGTLEILGDGSNMDTEGNRVAFGTGNTLTGGVLLIDGKGFFFSDGNVNEHSTGVNLEIGNAHGTSQNGSSGKTYTFTGDITGSGEWRMANNVRMTNILLGSLSDFHGTLSTSESDTNTQHQVWQFGNGGAYAGNNLFGDGTVLSGNQNANTDSSLYGSYVVNYNNAELTLNATVEGKANLTQAGTGTLILDKTNTSVGDLAITNAGATIQLGTADTAAKWSGSALSGAGTLKIVNGSLAQAMTRADGSTASIAVDAGTNTAINLGGTSGSLLSSVTLGAGSTLTNVNGNLVVGGTNGLTSLTLTLTDANVSQTSGTATAKIDQGNADLVLNDGASVTLNIDAIVNILVKNSDNFLALTTGNITGDYENIQFDKTLSTLGYRITGVDGGQLVLSGKAEGAYKVTGPTDETSEKPVVVNDYNTLGMYNSVVIDRNLSLVVNLPANPAEDEALHINNLLGATGSSLIVNNEDAATDALVLLNTDTDIAGGVGNLIGNDEEHAGNAGVTFVKQGQGTLTVSGRVETSTLQLQEGTLVIAGQGSDIDVIELNGLDGSPLPELAITGSATAGRLTDDVAGGKGGKVTLGQNAMLTLDMASDLSQSSIEGSGTLRLENTLALSGTAKIDGDLLVDLVGPDHADAQTFAAGDPVGTLDLGTTTDNRIGGLSGGGVLKGNGGAIAVGGDHGSVFEGSFEGSGTFTIDANAEQTLLNATTADGSQWRLVNNGTLNIVTGGSIDAPGENTPLALGSLTLNSGSTTHITLNTDKASPLSIEAGGTLTIQQGASIVLSSTGANELTANADGSYTLLSSGAFDLDGRNMVEITLDPTSPAFKKYASQAYLKDDGHGNLILVATTSDVNKYASAANSYNSLAGAELLWNLDGVDANSTLGQIDMTVGILASSSATQAEAARIMAAAAGSTVASLGMAQKDALRDQMGWIRNRLTNMGVDQALVNEDMPYFHMWAQATGNHATLDNKGDESGYTLDTWGGTVGLDLDVNEYLTFGAAFTAAYGDLDATGAETATGDLDSYYVNLFGRAQVKRWTHKLILSVGINDAKLTRTVDYGAGSYKARGTTNGTGFGAMYELTYDTYLNRERTAVLQPLLNLSIVSTTMDAYSENDGGTAGNAGLNVGKQDMTVGTVALGVRLAGQLSENALGRASFGEFRVNVAQDMGDDRSSASVGFIGAPGMTQRIRGAKEGMTAIQIGAGLTVPVGEQSSIFFDVNADFRSHASSVNGSVGYRYDF